MVKNKTNCSGQIIGQIANNFCGANKSIPTLVAYLNVIQKQHTGKTLIALTFENLL